MANTAPQILQKQPSENRPYSMDFAARLATGESISTISSITSETISGGSSDLTIASSGISGDTVTMWISGGSKNRYRIEVVITTSGGATLEGDGILKVSDK